MNIAKKLLFSLLLCGSVFAAACGDDGKTAAAGESCDAETSCESGTVCVVSSTSASEGTCTKTCLTKTECTDKAMPECKDATVFSGSTAGKTCQQGGPTPVVKAQKDEPCSAQQACDENLVCIPTTDGEAAGTCKEKCSSANCASPKSCQNGHKKIASAQDYPETCQNGPAPGTKDGTCSSSVACNAGLSCIPANDGDAQGTCVDECSPTNCASPKVCEAGSKKVAGVATAPNVCKVAVSGDCSDSEAICVNNSVCVNNTCEKTCTNPGTDGSADCTGIPGKPNCKNVTVNSAPVALCQA